MARFLHPNKRALRQWLEDEASTPDEIQANNKVDQHIATCERCASSIEALSAELPSKGEATAEVAGDASPTIQQALGTVLASPADLSERLERKVTARLDSRIMFDVVSDLFGAGVETSRLLLMEENDE